MTITTPEIRPADVYTQLRVFRLYSGGTLLVGEGKLHCPGGAPDGAEYHGEEALEITPGTELSVTRFEVRMLGHQPNGQPFWESTAVIWDGDKWVTQVELDVEAVSTACGLAEAQYYRDVEAGLYPEDEW